MLQASLQDNFGNSIGLDGELGIGLPKVVTRSIDFVKDKASAGSDAVKSAGSWVIDRTCALATDPKVQAGAAAAALYPSGYSQAGAAGVAATAAACSALRPPTFPGPPLQTLPTPWRMTASVMKPVASFVQRPPAAPTAPAIPAGSIATFDKKRGGFRIAVRAGLSGFGAEAAFTEVGVQSTLPANVRLVDTKTFDKETGTAKPFYKRPLVIGGIVAGVLVLGVGGYALSRR